MASLGHGGRQDCDSGGQIWGDPPCWLTVLSGRWRGAGLGVSPAFSLADSEDWKEPGAGGGEEGRRRRPPLLLVGCFLWSFS